MYDEWNDIQEYEDPTPDYEVWERNQLDRDMQAEREDEDAREHAESLVFGSVDIPGKWGFTGCDQDCYDSYAEALEAALSYVLDEDSALDVLEDAGAEEQQRIEAEMGEPRHDDIDDELPF